MATRGNGTKTRAHYRYDARNVEALAAQMALTPWRTILLGVQFEMYSDHDSLKYISLHRRLLPSASSDCAAERTIQVMVEAM